jgi:hypothetical protein
VSVIADYSGLANQFPIGTIGMKHLRLEAGQSPTQRIWKMALEKFKAASTILPSWSLIICAWRMSPMLTRSFTITKMEWSRFLFVHKRNDLNYDIRLILMDQRNARVLGEQINFQNDVFLLTSFQSFFCSQEIGSSSLLDGNNLIK